VRLLVALNDNLPGLLDQSQEVERHWTNSSSIIDSLGELIRQNEVMITHGEDEQIASIIRTYERGNMWDNRMGLDTCIAYAQGTLGYNLQQRLTNWLEHHKVHKNVVVLITRVLVEDENDLMQTEMGGIGPFYDFERARIYQQTLNWQMTLVPGRGYQRSVPVLDSNQILEGDSALQLMLANNVVICAGGGGIPVQHEEDGSFTRVQNALPNEARSATLLAERIGADAILFVERMRSIVEIFHLNQANGLCRIDLEGLNKLIVESDVNSRIKRRLVASKRYLENGGKPNLYLAPYQVRDLFKADIGACICAAAGCC
jgi:carbamate kinase